MISITARSLKNGCRPGGCPPPEQKEETDMKLIRIAFLITTLVALQAPAQTNQSSPKPASNLPPGLVNPSTPAPPPVMPERGKFSYAIGMNLANSFKSQSVDVDVNALAAGITDILASNSTRITLDEMTNTLKQLSGALRAKAQEKMEKEAAENKSKGDEFLAKHAKLDGVISLTNGIQYKVITNGTGNRPQPTDTVTVSYRGTLIDGTEFDKNDLFRARLKGGVIKGWSEILPMMKVGSKWEVVIPSDLAYGKRSMGAKIGPNSVLIFEIELLSIVPPAPPAVAPAAPTSVMRPAAANAAPAATTTTPVVSGQIIKVPSAEGFNMPPAPPEK
jgi:FKBP-type peptidyl-prolyl cis-trans isomerase FklB